MENSELEKHIVIIQNTTLAENYGLSTYLRNIVQQLSKQHNLRVSVICSAGKLNKQTIPENIELYEVPVSTYSLKGNAIFAWQTARLLRRINKKCHVFLIHALYPNSSVFGAVISRLLGVRSILLYDLRSPWIHVSVERGSIKKAFVPIYLTLAYASERFLSLFVQRFIFITEGLRRFYQPRLFLGKKPIAVIPSGIDVAAFHPNGHDYRGRYKLQPEDVIVGYVGAISKMRDLGSVVQVFAGVANKRSDLKLVFVGDGDDLDSLKRLAHNCGIKDRVVFTGRVANNEIPRLVQMFDVGICNLPDTFIFRQSSPMKVLEYLASGVPVLASNIQAHRNIAETFSQVKLYTDYEDLVHKLDRVQKKERVISPDIQNYDWGTITQSIISLYTLNADK